MELGRKMLGKRQVLPGVAELVHEVQIEGTFADGTKLVTVHDPIVAENGDLKVALHGSFLPLPDLNVFPPLETSVSLPGTSMTNQLPLSHLGPFIVKEGVIELNVGRPRIALKVTNNGDR